MSVVSLIPVSTPNGDRVAQLAIFGDPNEATVLIFLTKDQLAELSDKASDIWNALPKEPVEPVEKSSWPAHEQEDFRDESRERSAAINRELGKGKIS